MTTAARSSPPPRRALDFLQGGGEMGTLIRAHDWAASSIGSPEGWSQGLRSALGLLLSASQPMYVWWGRELLCFYNDAYRRSIGPERHPGSLGQPGQLVWQEIWDIIGPQIEQVLSGGGSVSHHNALVPITRHGRREEVYWSYSYNPIFDSNAPGGIGGVLVICAETTEEVRSAARAAAERRHLAELFEQAPNFMAMLKGPEHRFELANPAFLGLIGDRDVLGRTVAEALPETIAQGYVAILDEVYRSGRPYIARGARYEMPADGQHAARPRRLDFVYQPIRDATGAVTGIFVEGSDVTARALAETALRESEARFRDIADATPVLIWISDVTGTCVWFNSRWLEFTGREITEEVGVGWVEGVHPEDLDRCVRVYEESFRRREPYRTEYRRRRHDGAWRLLDATGVPRIVDGEFVGFIGSCIDVTEQRAAARTLADREEQLRLATEAAEVGLWDVDLVTDTLYWPARVKAMFGISPGVAVSLADFYAGLHPDDKRATSAAFAAAADTGRRALYDVEYRTVGKEDGVIRWVAAKGRGVFRHGRCVRILGTVIDITTRKAAEAQLRELNDRLEQRVAEALAERKVYVDIIESTDALVLVLDLDYRILAINRATVGEFVALYGGRPRVGDNLLELLGHVPQQRLQTQRFWSRALGGEEFTATGESAGRDGRKKCYEMKFNSLRDRNGRLIGAFQFVYDISARMRDQERLAEAENQLRQAQKIDALGQLTGGVAHDFNNLLMVISGGLGLLQRVEGDTERTQRIIDQMRQAANRGAALCRQLLTFARRQPLKAEPVDLKQLIDRMRELLDRTLRGDVQVRTELAGDLWPINADPAELELVVLNLCVNARDAMPQGGAITIGAKNVEHLSEGGLEGEFVAMTVADTGTGMSAEVLGRLFEPFFTTKEPGKGSGLGLAQVYGFAKQSGGSVRVESVEGSGTVVRLSLPRSAAAPPAPPPPDADLDTTARRRALAGSILLVEDNDEVAALVGEMLRELGYRVTRVASAQAALGALTDDHPLDLVFSDVLMPGPMSGVDLAREIRRRRPGMPVLLTTGYAGAALECADEERIPVLKKPYEMQALEAALKRAVRSSRERA